MRKALAALAVLLLLAAGVLPPYLVGRAIEQGFPAALDHVAFQSGTDLHLSAYRRGWFSSHALTEVRAPGLQAPLQLRHEIRHGPWLWGQGLQIGEIETVPIGNDATALRGVSHVRPDGSVATELRFTGLDQGDAENGLRLPPAAGRLNFDALSRHLDGDFSLPGASLKDDGQQLHVDDVRLRLALDYEPESRLLLGRSELSMAALTVSGGEAPLVLEGLTLGSESRLQAARIDQQLDLRSGELRFGEQRYGPLHLRLAVDNLRLDALLALRELQQRMQRLQREGRSAEEIQATLGFEMLPLLPQLLDGSELRLEALRLQSPRGTLQGRLLFAAPGFSGGMLLNPALALQSMRFEARFSAEEPLWHQLFAQGVRQDPGSAAFTPAQIDALAQARLDVALASGWLVRENEKLTLDMALQDGLLQINQLQLDPLAILLPQIK